MFFNTKVCISELSPLYETYLVMLLSPQNNFVPISFLHGSKGYQNRLYKKSHHSWLLHSVYLDENTKWGMCRRRNIESPIFHWIKLFSIESNAAKSTWHKCDKKEFYKIKWYSKQIGMGIFNEDPYNFQGFATTTHHDCYIWSHSFQNMPLFYHLWEIIN